MRCITNSTVSLLKPPVRNFARTYIAMSGTSHETTKNQDHVAAGLKATLHRKGVSEEAKTHARERLHEMGVDPESHLTYRGTAAASGTTHEPKPSHESVVHDHRVIAGYKATLKNTRASEEAKANARKMLAAHGIDADA